MRGGKIESVESSMPITRTGVRVFLEEYEFRDMQTFDKDDATHLRLLPVSH